MFFFTIYVIPAIILFSNASAPPSWLLDSWMFGDAVGKSCRTRADCESYHARCINGDCVCLSTQVFANGKCLPKINPGQSPCSEDIQCTSLWPDTRCVNTICQCINGVHVMTRDGVVCIEPESCPLGGKEAVLRNKYGDVAECFIGPAGYMSGCLDQLHMYDCIRDRNNGSRFFCCPSKANTCSQPKDEGEALDNGDKDVKYTAPRKPL